MTRRARLLAAAAAILCAIGLLALRSSQPSIDPSRVAFDPAERPQVAEIHPAADEVPENLLRFYVRFSRPMERGAAAEQVYLLGEDGARVAGPFLRIGEELWSRDMQVLTLMLDPGRIKRGVSPNLEAGGPMRAGRRYTLVVGAGMTDRHHRPMAGDYRKDLVATAADREGPDPSRWRLEPPAAGTSRPLRVRFEAPVDPFVAERLIRVETSAGRPLPGKVSIGPRSDRLEFVPQAPWRTGSYRLAVHPALEDVAGNRVSTPFEMPSGTVAELRGSGKVLTLDFSL